MKTKQILWIITTFIVGAIIVVGTTRLDAQTTKMIEKKIGNRVYELDAKDYTLKNKANKISYKDIGNSDVFVDNSEQDVKDWEEANQTNIFKRASKRIKFQDEYSLYL